jgi:hypothetical protein
MTRGTLSFHAAKPGPGQKILLVAMAVGLLAAAGGAFVLIALSLATNSSQSAVVVTLLFPGLAALAAFLGAVAVIVHLMRRHRSPATRPRGSERQLLRTLTEALQLEMYVPNRRHGAARDLFDDVAFPVRVELHGAKPGYDVVVRTRTRRGEGLRIEQRATGESAGRTGDFEFDARFVVERDVNAPALSPAARAALLACIDPPGEVSFEAGMVTTRYPELSPSEPETIRTIRGALAAQLRFAEAFAAAAGAKTDSSG